MKTGLALLLSFMLTAGAAAADHPSSGFGLRASYGSASGHDWSGAYIGGHIGHGWGRAANDWSLPPAVDWTPDGTIDYSSFTGGIQAGYLQQMDQFVAGIEADLGLARYRGDDARFAGRINDIGIDALGSLRGRLGWAADKLLVYGTAGLAAARIRKGDEDGVRGTPQLATGWTAGGGVEIAVSEALSLRAEYLHVRLGDVTSPLFVNGGAGYLHRANAPALDVIRLGANYRF